MFVSMCFKIMSKVVKYTCRLRRYNYTHDQLNTRHFIIIVLDFFEGGGRAQNSSLPPGARYPRYATVSRGSKGPAPPPPLEIEKQKKRSSEQI